MCTHNDDLFQIQDDQTLPSPDVLYERIMSRNPNLITDVGNGEYPGLERIGQLYLTGKYRLYPIRPTFKRTTFPTHCGHSYRSSNEC